jgi:hypothetical protein
MARRRPAAPLPGGDVLPLELMPLTEPTGLFAAFTVRRSDGKLGLDLGAYAEQSKAEEARKAGFDSWFARRGISTRYADRDARYGEVLAASRAHWGLNHQGREVVHG